MTERELHQDLLEWQWWVKHSGDKGIKTSKLVSLTDRLNELLGEALVELDGSFRVWCRPWRPKDKRQGDECGPENGIADFTIYVQEGKKKAVPLYLYSGGETSLVALAFLIAFWKLTDERGQGTNLLLLDEVVGALDSRNSQIVAQFLETLKLKGKTVLCVSHNQVVDTVNFDQHWRVIKEQGIARVERSVIS